MRTSIQSYIEEAEVDAKADVSAIGFEKRYLDAAWDAYGDRSDFEERSGRRHVEE